MAAVDPGVLNLIIFVLAVIVGYYVVLGIPSALQTPFMAVSSAISSVIVVGALIATGTADISVSMVIGFLAVILAAINIGCGFAIARRMRSYAEPRD